MTRELALLVMVGVAVALLALGVWAWSRRVRRDSDVAAPVGEAPDSATTRASFSGLYVATTAANQPLERLAIRGMGFRSRVDITVTSAGVALDLTGQPRIFLASERLTGVRRAQVAIDRVIEPDGLVCVSWRAQSSHGDVIVDSYLRAQEASSLALENAISGILPPHPTTIPMGTDA